MYNRHQQTSCEKGARRSWLKKSTIHLILYDTTLLMALDDPQPRMYSVIPTPLIRSMLKHFRRLPTTRTDSQWPHLFLPVLSIDRYLYSPPFGLNRRLCTEVVAPSATSIGTPHHLAPMSPRQRLHIPLVSRPTAVVLLQIRRLIGPPAMPRR